MRPPARLYSDADGKGEVGHVTSGGFGPSINQPVAMGYVDTKLAAVGTPLFAEVRGKFLSVTVSALPFVPNTFKR